MQPEDFISRQAPERQAVMATLHKAIINSDPSLKPVIEPMMGMEMIIYKERDYMKYGLASGKKHMSLHCLPMYMDPAIHAKYSELLPSAKFQKGCINFTDAEQFPLASAKDLITECALVNIADALEKRKKK